MIYSHDNYKKNPVNEESQPVNEFLLMALGASLLLGGLSSVLINTAASIKATSDSFKTLADIFGKDKDDKKDKKDKDDKGNGKGDKDGKEDGKGDGEGEPKDNPMANAMNIAAFAQKKVNESGSDEDKAFLGKMMTTLFDKDGNPVKPEEFAKAMEGDLGKEIGDFASKHKEELEKEGLDEKGMLKEANKMSEVEKAQSLTDMSTAAVAQHHDNAIKEAEKQHEENLKKLERERDEAIAAAGKDNDKITEIAKNYETSVAKANSDFESKHRAMVNEKNVAMVKALKKGDATEMKALEKEKAQKIKDAGDYPEVVADINKEYDEKKAELEKKQKERGEKYNLKKGEPKEGEPKEEPKEGEPKEGEPKEEPKEGEPKEEPKEGEPKEGEPKEGEPKEGEPKEEKKTKETFKDKDGTEYTKDGDKYTMKTKDGDTVEINKDEYDNQQKAVQRSYKTNDDKKFPYVDDDGDETGMYVVKNDDGTYEMQDEDGNKTGDANEDDFKDAKQNYDDEKEDIENEGEDKEEGDDIDDGTGKKIENPSKVWHKKKNKRTGKPTKSYFNKKGDSINPKEFHDKLKHYRERKRAMTQESRRFTEKTLSEYLFEKLGK